jgi:hypothetical protein
MNFLSFLFNTMTTRKATKLALKALKAKNWRTQKEYLKHYRKSYYNIITKPKNELKKQTIRYKMIKSILVFLKKYL